MIVRNIMKILSRTVPAAAVVILLSFIVPTEVRADGAVRLTFDANGAHLVMAPLAYNE